MNKLTRAAVGLISAAAAAVVLAPAPALAITGGQPDGDAHPSVGLISFYDDGLRYRCSATLVTPTVLVTAAHCTFGVEGKTAVTFDTFIAEAPPSGLPEAADPATGYTSEDITAGGYVAGTGYSHPDYSDFTDMDNWNDVGVIVLDEPVTDITPSPIAPTNYLQQFKGSTLSKTLFTIVGYGTEVRKSEEGPQKPTPQSYPLLRRNADAPGQKLTPQILQVNGNIHDTRGTGGSCFGDSGGPTFHGGYVVTVTSYGYTDNCRYIDGLQRIDIPVVQDWLAEFGIMPGA